MEIQISLLRPELKSALESGLDLAARLADAPRPLSDAHVEALYNAFLEEGFEDPDAIIALGLSFGEGFVARGGFEWVRVLDEYGEETCVAVLGKATFCSPISMIQKRLTKAERPDIRLLREETIRILDDMVAEGSADR